MEKKNKWKGTCFTCLHGNCKQVYGKRAIYCILALDENSFPEVKQYCCENTATGRPKFHFRVPNIHEKYQECRYYKKLGETQESNFKNSGYDLHLFCALNLIEQLETIGFIHSEDKQNLIDMFTGVLTKTYAIT